jgi:hypothetical protein
MFVLRIDEWAWQEAPARVPMLPVPVGGAEGRSLLTASRHYSD